jgi:predicted RNase H-like HicB family nuclease
MVKEDIKAQVEHYAQLPYTTIVERMEDQGIYYVARILELDGLMMTGETPEEAVAELESVKREWIESYLELGNKMPQPLKSRKYSGQYRIRMEPSLHEKLALLAEMEGVSLNQFMVTRLAITAGQKLYEELDRIKRRIRELVEKSGILISWYEKGYSGHKSTLTEEEEYELNSLNMWLELIEEKLGNTQGTNQSVDVLSNLLKSRSPQSKKVRK